MDSCRNCVFWKQGGPFPESNTGVCRRYPPRVFVFKNATNTSTSAFPPMQPDGWCGEHQGYDDYVKVTQ